MKRSRVLFLCLAACVAATLAAPRGGAEGTATGSKLPDPVAKTFNTNFPKAEIHMVDAADENGVMVYDIEFKEGDQEKETDIAAEGTMLEWTLVVAAEAVPAAAMKSISKAAKGAAIGRLEQVEMTHETLDGKVVALPKVTMKYAAEMTKGKKMAEVVVSPDGAVIESPEWVAIEVKPAAKAAE